MGRQIFYNKSITKNRGQIWLPIAVATPVVPDNPVLTHLHYTLDESTGAVAADESANSFDGTLQNMENGDWGLGEIDNALTFGGTDEDILVDHAGAGDFDWNDPFSVSFWIKYTNAGGVQSIVSKINVSGGAALTGWYVYNASGVIAFQYNSNAGASQYMGVYTNNTFNDDDWHHVCVVYNGSGHKGGVHIYVDGVDEALTALSDTLVVSSSLKHAVKLRIGSDESTGNFLEGSLDDVRIYDQVLSEAQVTALFNKTEPQIETATVEDLHMKLDDASVIKVIDDSSNRYDGVGLISSRETGVVGDAALFDGTNDYMDLGHVLPYEKDEPFSVSFWYNGSATGTNENVIIKMRSGGDYRGWRIKVNSSNVLQFEIIGTTGSVQVQGQNSIRDGAWNHCVITYDGSEDVDGVEMYVNNSAETESDVVNTLAGSIVDETERCFIGVYEGIGERLNATIDDLRVIPAVLTSDQRAFLYNSGNGTQDALSA